MTEVSGFPIHQGVEVAGYFTGSDDFVGSVSEPETVIQGYSSVVTFTSSSNPQESTKPVTLTASVARYDGFGSLTDGTLTIRDLTTDTILGTRDVAGGPSLSVTVMLTLGTHELSADYSGQSSPTLIGASSAGITQQVVQDKVVDLSGTGLTMSKFYPVVDSYRDTVGIHGTLGEPATVTIRIKSVDTGKTVRTVSLGAKSIGKYQWSWNGRNDKGRASAKGPIHGRPDGGRREWQRGDRKEYGQAVAQVRRMEEVHGYEAGGQVPGFR